MKLATRLFLGTSLLVAATVTGLVTATDRLLRERLESSIAAGLEGHARLIAALLPPDSSVWPEQARRLGQTIGHRVTLVGPDGWVRGDADFDRAALPRLENHGTRPEIRAALAGGVGRDARRSASSNEPQLYVAVRGGPPGVAAVRVSASLASVDAQIQSVQRAFGWSGALAILAAALLAWPLSAAFARPLAMLTTAARRIAAGEEPEFPSSRVPEIAEHAVALHGMAGQLAERFRALRAEQDETRTLIESMSDGVIAADPRGEVITSNSAARRLLEYGDGPLPPLTELFHDKPGRDVVRTALAGQPVEQMPLSRGRRELVVTGRPLPEGGVLLMLRDVTALRRLEAMRRDFVANVSHELKTPLTSIAGYAETLAGEARLDAQARAFAATILHNARRMQHLVDDLLDLSRIESGGWDPQWRAVDLSGAVREAWAAFADDATRRGVRFETRVAPDAGTLAADPAALHQILTNLFDNALRHTLDGGTIEVGATHASGESTLWVSDTGVGIPAEHLPRIFERFYRVDSGRGRDSGGTGLGLAIVKHLIEAHGGRMTARSVPGRGTTIRMVFPTSAAPPEPASPSVTEP